MSDPRGWGWRIERKRFPRVAATAWRELVFQTGPDDRAALRADLEKFDEVDWHGMDVLWDRLELRARVETRCDVAAWTKCDSCMKAWDGPTCPPGMRHLNVAVRMVFPWKPRKGTREGGKCVSRVGWPVGAEEWSFGEDEREDMCDIAARLRVSAEPSPDPEIEETYGIPAARKLFDQFDAAGLRFPSVWGCGHVADAGYDGSPGEAGLRMDLAFSTDHVQGAAAAVEMLGGMLVSKSRGWYGGC